jgi:hypothetical protein
MVTMITTRDGPPDNVTLEQSIRGWENQEVDLSNVGMCAWISGDRERGKPRKIFNNASHVLLVGVRTKLETVPYMEDFEDGELEVAMRECLTGMWKAKMGEAPH